MTSPAEDRTQHSPVCYRHSNRPTNVRCQNCEKPICADCMRDTPVGFRCPDCAGKSRQVFREDLIVTKVLLGICLAVYLLQVGIQVVNGVDPYASLMDMRFNALYLDGSLWAPGIAQSDQWWRVVTGGFLHGSLIHIAFNSYFIWSFGQLLEPALGRLRFGLLYFLGLGGGAAGALLLTTVGVPTVGASGAGFGLLGAALVMARLRRNEQLANQFMILALINFALTFAIPNISLGGHLGGFLAGALGGYLAYGPLVRQQKLMALVLGGLVVALFVAAIVIADVRFQSAIASLSL